MFTVIDPHEGSQPGPMIYHFKGNHSTLAGLLHEKILNFKIVLSYHSDGAYQPDSGVIIINTKIYIVK